MGNYVHDMALLAISRWWEEGLLNFTTFEEGPESLANEIEANFQESYNPTWDYEKPQPKDFGQQWDKAGPHDLANRLARS